MTGLLLGAILCVLVFISRELRHLRKQRENSPSAAEQQEHFRKYKRRIFTFTRAGWASRMIDVEEWLGTIAAVVIWFKFVLPLLPGQPWIRYPITIVGLLVVGFLAIMAVELLLGIPIERLMDGYDERVYK